MCSTKPNKNMFYCIQSFLSPQELDKDCDLLTYGRQPYSPFRPNPKLRGRSTTRENKARPYSGTRTHVYYGYNSYVCDAVRRNSRTASMTSESCGNPGRTRKQRACPGSEFEAGFVCSGVGCSEHEDLEGFSNRQSSNSSSGHSSRADLSSVAHSQQNRQGLDEINLQTQLNYYYQQQQLLQQHRVYHSNPSSSINLSNISSSYSFSSRPITPGQSHDTRLALSANQIKQTYIPSDANKRNAPGWSASLGLPSGASVGGVNSTTSSYNFSGQTAPNRPSQLNPRRSLSAYRMSSASSKEVLKILAEVFRIGPEKQLMSEKSLGIGPGDPTTSIAPEWEKLSESLVPITVVIMEESPVRVLHVTGIVFPDKKIMDSKLFHPGTKIIRTSNCFVQWSDRTKGGLWGLNFISEKDAQRFLNSCAPESPTRGLSSGAPQNSNPNMFAPQLNVGATGVGSYPHASTPPSPSRRLHAASPKHHMIPDMALVPPQHRPSSCVQMEESVHMVGDMLFIKTNQDSNSQSANTSGSSTRHNSRQSPLIPSSVAHWNTSGMVTGCQGLNNMYPGASSGSSRTRSLTPVSGALHGHSLSLSNNGSRYQSPVPPQFYHQQSPRSDSPLSVSSNGSCSRHTCGKPLPPGPNRMSSPLPPPSYFQNPQMLPGGEAAQMANAQWVQDAQRNLNYTQECMYGSINVVQQPSSGSYPSDIPRNSPFLHGHSHSHSSSDSRNFSPDHLPPPNVYYDQFRDSSTQGHRRKGSAGSAVIPPHLALMQSNNDAIGSPFLPRGFRAEAMLPNNPSNDDSVVYSELFAIMKSKDTHRASPCSTGPNNTLERASRFNNSPIVPPRMSAAYAYPSVPAFANTCYDPDLLSLNDGESGVGDPERSPKPPVPEKPKMEVYGGIPLLNDSKSDNEPSPETDSPDFNDDLPPPNSHQQVYYPPANPLRLNNPGAPNYMNVNMQQTSSAVGLNRSLASSEGFVSPGSEMNHVCDAGFSLDDIQNSKRDSTVSQTDSGFEGHHGGAPLSAAGSDHQFAPGDSNRKGSASSSSHSSIAKRESNPLMLASPAKTNTSDSSTTSSNKGIGRCLIHDQTSEIAGRNSSPAEMYPNTRRPDSSCAASDRSGSKMPLANNPGPNQASGSMSGEVSGYPCVGDIGQASSIDNLTDDSHSNSSKGGGLEDTVRSFVDCNESLSEDNKSDTSEISRQVGPGIPGLLDLGSGNPSEYLGARKPPGQQQGSKSDAPDEEEDNCVDPTDATFRRFGVTRKAGWLEIKHVLFLNSKKKKLEAAPKRKWKRYWACLKGHSLLFYSIQTELPSIDENSVPELVLGIENSIAQPIPEHPKRENVFSLSTYHGNVYLCEAQSTAELENWITAVHSSCANAIVLRGNQKQGGSGSNLGVGSEGGSTVSIVSEEVRRCEQRIDIDLKMKKMAELQLSIMNEQKSRQNVVAQINSWELNLEQLNCDLYRLKCYAASLQGTELPNPRTLLSAVSKDTKLHLSRLNVFSASSVHALLSGKCVMQMEQQGQGQARTHNLNSSMVNSESSSSSLERGRRKMYHHMGGNEQSRSPNSQDSRDQPTGNHQESTSSNRNPRSSVSPTASNSSHRPFYSNADGNQPSYLIPPNSASIWENLSKGKLARVFLPHNQKTVEAVIPQMTVNELLLRCCRKRRLDPRDHFIRIRAPDRTWVIPSPKATLESLNCQDIEVCIKEYHAVVLTRGKNERFGIEYETVEEHVTNKDASGGMLTSTGYPRMFVRDILPGSIAQNGGLEPGDEILQINNQFVGKQNSQNVDDLLKTDHLNLVIRSLRPSTAPCPQCKEHLEPDGPNVSHFKRSSFYGEDMMIPVDKRKSGLSENSNNSSSGVASTSSAVALGFDSGGNSQSAGSGVITAQNQAMKDGTRLGCLIQELISTEENYIKDLKFLLEVYLEPLLQCSFLIDIEVETVTSNVHEIVAFQEKFFRELKSSVELEPNYGSFEDVAQFKTILIKLSNAFKCYTDHFKLYSAFCANHSKAQRVFAEVKDVPEFRDMLDQKNPEQEHSRSLESFLIKPIQRVLKYPLILREIKSIVGGGSSTGADQSQCSNVAMSAEFEGLASALRAMENVAEHINDMKRIHEEYGPVFEQLLADQETKYIHELPMDELLMYGSASWVNCPEDLLPRKLRNNCSEIDVMIFVFKRAVIILPGLSLLQNKEKQKKRRLTLPGPEKKASEQEICKVRSLVPISTISLCKEKKEELPKKFYWDLISSRTEFHICKNQHFQMLSRSAETRRQFVRAIVRCVHDLMKAQQEINRSLSAISRTANERRLRRSNSQHSTRSGQGRSNQDSESNQRNSAKHSEYDSVPPLLGKQVSSSSMGGDGEAPSQPHHQYHHQDLDNMPRAIIPTYYPPLTEGTSSVTLPSQLSSHILMSSQNTPNALSFPTSEFSRKTQADSGVFLEELEQHYINTSSPNNSSFLPDTAPFIPPRPMSTVPHGGFTQSSGGSTSTAAALLSPSDFRNRSFSPMGSSRSRERTSNTGYYPSQQSQNSNSMYHQFLMNEGELSSSKTSAA